MLLHLHHIALAVAVLTICSCIQGARYINIPSSKECKFTEGGFHYTGKLAIAASGKTCLPWSGITSFDTEKAFGNGSVTEMRNYCRAPLINGTTDMPEGPWCFTVTGTEYCNVSHCSTHQFKSTRQCLKDNGFMSYAGNFTWKDRCLAWTEDIVHREGFELWQFPGSYSWVEMADYCRNPDNDETPWCFDKQIFQLNGKLERLACDNITACSTKCRVTEGSLEYTGKRDRTETRKKCVPAQLMIPAIFQGDAERRRWFEAKYVNDDYYINLTECRSYSEQMATGVNEAGPSCYVSNPNTGEITEESCALHFCIPADFNISAEFYGYHTTSTEDEYDFGTIKPPVQVETTTSVEAGFAWKLLLEWTDNSEGEVEAQNSQVAAAMGIAIFSVTGLLLLLLMMLDCSSIHQCTARCKKNSEQMKELYGSRISLRSNQVSPDSESGDHMYREMRRNVKKSSSHLRPHVV